MKIEFEIIILMFSFIKSINVELFLFWSFI